MLHIEPSTMIFRRLTVVIDLVGLIGAGLATTGFYFTSLTGNETAQLFGNLGIELVGSWISVRILEFILRRRTEFKESRIQVLRNLRFYLHHCRRMRASFTLNDVEHLSSELDYTRHVFKNRSRFLYRTEIDRCNRAFAMIDGYATISETVLKSIDDFHVAAAKLDHTLRDTRFDSNAQIKISTISVARSQISDISRRIVRDELPFVEIIASQIGVIETQVRHIAELDPPELAEFVEVAMRVADGKSDLCSKWRELEVLIGEIEEDIRAETPEY